MGVVGERFHDGSRFLECSCSCGDTYFAFAEDVEAGLVRSCGSRLAGRGVEGLFDRRFPAPPGLSMPRKGRERTPMLPFGRGEA